MNDGGKRNPWDERFDTPDYVYGTDPNEFLSEVADRIPKGKVLCLGEGEGRNAVYLAGRGYDVTAVDSSAVGLGKARSLAGRRGVEIVTVHSDVALFDIEPEAWAGIVSIFLHLPPGARAALHRRCVRGLRAGGAFVLEAYSPRQLEYGTGGPRSLDLLVPLEAVEEELEGLQFETALETVRRVHEGRFHNGDGAVVRILGIKPA